MSLMALGYLLLYFGGLGAALVRHPMWGLYAYFLAFYVHPPSRWWSAEVPDLRWSYIAAIATCVAEPGALVRRCSLPMRLSRSSTRET